LNIAIPTAMGTIRSAMPGRKPPPTLKRGLSAMMAATRKAPAYANHLSCSRSSPVARRNRMMREAAEAIPSRNISRTPATWISYASLKVSEAPAGATSVMFVRTRPLIGQAASAIGITVITMATAPSHAMGRHRRDGSRPSGKSRKR